MPWERRDTKSEPEVVWEKSLPKPEQNPSLYFLIPCLQEAS